MSESTVREGGFDAFTYTGGEVVAAGGEDGAIRFWSLSSGALLATKLPKTNCVPHKGPVIKYMPTSLNRPIPALWLTAPGGIDCWDFV
jgi:WD40 repeat protein